jgi:glucose-1-phosphate cytidylyltransferase|tara:strand:- start:533 stop:1234 length:702 start_codon:yes stop_codon:yes gene_type:complete
MKTVILAGGLGTRLAEYTDRIPKPMVQLGTKPILSHIMNFYQSYGYDDFIIAAGYKKEIINEYYKDSKEFKNLKIVDTGKDTMTGGRLLRLKSYFNKNEDFFMTYGDGLCAINLDDLKKFHENHKKVATVTAVHPPVRFGELEIIGDYVVEFEEKPQAKAGWINGGYFTLNYKVFDYIKNDKTLFEKEPMKNLLNNKNLKAYKYEGFWKCMDTLRDKIDIEKILIDKGEIWKK